LLPLGVQAQLPEIPYLIRVTVEHADNGVLIEWEASTSPKIMFYIISENIRQGFAAGGDPSVPFGGTGSAI
jgi:hypothetical protein